MLADTRRIVDLLAKRTTQNTSTLVLCSTPSQCSDLQAELCKINIVTTVGMSKISAEYFRRSLVDVHILITCDMRVNEMPYYSPYNKGRVARLLCYLDVKDDFIAAGRKALQSEQPPEQVKEPEFTFPTWMGAYPRHNASWTHDEEKTLNIAYAYGMSLKHMAKKHGRTEIGIHRKLQQMAGLPLTFDMFAGGMRPVIGVDSWVSGHERAAIMFYKTCAQCGEVHAFGCFKAGA